MESYDQSGALVLWNNLDCGNTLHLYLIYHCLQLSYGLHNCAPFPFVIPSVSEAQTTFEKESIEHLHYVIEKIQDQKYAEEQLLLIEKLPGYFPCLLQIILQQEENHTQTTTEETTNFSYCFDKAIRFASILTLKNTCLRNWRNLTSGEDKSKIREFLLSHLQEEDDLLAKNIAVLFSIIARLDGLKIWQDILESLVSTYHNEIIAKANSNNFQGEDSRLHFSLLGIRVGFTLERVVKELSKKRLKADKVLFEEKGALLLPTLINEIWYPLLQQFLKVSFRADGEGENNTYAISIVDIDGILLESCINITKVIYKIILRTYNTIEKGLLESFFTYLLTVIKSLSSLEQQIRIQIYTSEALDKIGSQTNAIQIKLMDLNKLLKRSTQIMIDIQEYAKSFAAYLLPSTVNHFFEELVMVCQSEYQTILCYNMQEEGTLALPNKYYLRIVRYLNFIISTFCLQPLESIPNLADENDRQLCDFTRKYFESDNRIETLITILLSNLLTIQPFELELWLEDSEEYKTSIEQVEVEENLRCAGEYLFLSLLDYQGGMVCETLLGLLNDYDRQSTCLQCYIRQCTSKESNTVTINDYRILSDHRKEIFLWDSIYLGLGLSSYKIAYEYKDSYLKWFKDFLIPSMELLLKPMTTENSVINSSSTISSNNYDEARLPPMLHRRIVWLLSCYQHIIQDSLELTEIMYEILIRMLVRPKSDEDIGFFYHYDMATTLTCVQTLSSMLENIPIEGSKLIADNACTEDGVLFHNLYRLIYSPDDSPYKNSDSYFYQGIEEYTVMSINSKLEIFELINVILVSISDYNDLTIETMNTIVSFLPDLWNQSLNNDDNQANNHLDGGSIYGNTKGYGALSISVSGISHSQSSQQILRSSTAPRLNSKGADVEVRRAILTLLYTLIKSVGNKDILIQHEINLKNVDYEENNLLFNSCIRKLEVLESVILFVEESTKLDTNDTDMLLEDGIKLWSIYLNYLLSVQTLLRNEIKSLSKSPLNNGQRIDTSILEEALQNIIAPLKNTSYQILSRVHEITSMRDAAYLVDLMTIAETYLLLGSQNVFMESESTTVNNLQELSLETEVWNNISFVYTQSIYVLLSAMPDSKKNFLVNNIEILLILAPNTGAEALVTSGILEHIIASITLKYIGHICVTEDNEIPDYVIGQYVSILARVILTSDHCIDEVVGNIVKKGQEKVTQKNVDLRNNSIEGNGDVTDNFFHDGNLCKGNYYLDLLQAVENHDEIIGQSYQEKIIYIILDTMITLFDTVSYNRRGFLRRKTILICILSCLSHGEIKGQNTPNTVSHLKYPNISAALLENRLIELFSMYENFKGELYDKNKQDEDERINQQKVDENEGIYLTDYLLPHVYIDEDMANVKRYKEYVFMDIFFQTDMSRFLQEKIRDAQALYGEGTIQTMIKQIEPSLVPEEIL